jgi:hypothetical protein
VEFVQDRGRITLADPDVFKRDPVNIIRLFHVADINGLEFHPDALKRVTRSLKLINNALREDEEANRLFLSILTSPRNPALMLRRMNEAGVLGRFIPDFGKIVAMMQFNMYHHYTVDEHLIRAVGVLSDRQWQGGEKEAIRLPSDDALGRGAHRRSMSRSCCTTSPRAGRRIIRLQARASPASSARASASTPSRRSWSSG